MLYILEFLIAAVVIGYFMGRERPNPLFLLWGLVFFFLSLILQLPVRVLQFYVTDWMPESLFPVLITGVGGVVINEVTKYFSLRQFMATRRYKNGILFGLVWITLESITIVSAMFYGKVFALLGISFDPYLLLSEPYGLFSFVYFFLINAAITVYVIIGVIKRRYWPLVIGIMMGSLIFIGLQLLSGIQEAGFVVVSMLISLYVIFRYRALK